MIALIATSWVLQGFSLLERSGLEEAGRIARVVGLVIFLGHVSGSFISGFGHVANVVEREPRLSLFGVSLPWLAVVLLYEALDSVFHLPGVHAERWNRNGCIRFRSRRQSRPWLR